MHLYKTIKNFLFDQDYFVDIWKNYTHVYGIVDIIELNEKRVVLLLENFKLQIIGKDFRVLKLTKNEILIEGTLEEMRKEQ